MKSKIMGESKFSRRQFLTMCAGAVVLAGTGWGLVAQKKQIAAMSANEVEIAGVQFIRQLVASDNATARTIMWQTSTENKQLNLEYRAKNGADLQKIIPNCEEFSDDGQTKYIYTVALTNLTPTTEWEYRLVDQDENGPWYSLKLASNDNVCALIFPDSQSNDYTD